MLQMKITCLYNLQKKNETSVFSVIILDKWNWIYIKTGQIY